MSKIGIEKLKKYPTFNGKGILRLGFKLMFAKLFLIRRNPRSFELIGGERYVMCINLKPSLRREIGPENSPKTKKVNRRPYSFG